MGTGYTRNDTPNNIADGNVINASDLDGEFDAIQSAFNGSTGHSHDGTTGEGPQIATAGLADNAVTTAKITDANVTTAKIADANVTLAKMAANSIDSDQYVDGSIDTAHIADDAVTSAKLDTNIQIAGTLGVTGVSSFADGSNSAPSLTFTSDTNTGIYRGGTDILKFVTAGTDAITIDSDQDVILGNKLSLKASLTNPITFENQHGVTTDASISTFDDSAGTAIAFGSNYFFNSSGGEERFNTGEESSAVLLNRTGTVQLKTGSTGAVAVNRLIVDSAGDISFYEDTGTTAKLFWDASEEALGIGTASPARTLSVERTGGSIIGTFKRTDGPSAFITFEGSTTTTDAYVGIGAEGDDLFLRSGNAEKLRIDSAGRVGIGVTPTAQFSHNILQIGNQATLGANAALSTTGQTYLTHNLYYDTGGTLQVYNTGSANEGALLQMLDGQLRFSNSSATTGTPTVDERMRITSEGNVGIGTDSPNVVSGYTNVTINGTTGGFIDFENSGTHNGRIVGESTGMVIEGVGSRFIKFHTDSTERMRLDSSGSLLVGTTSDNPSATNSEGISLHNNGQIDASRNGSGLDLNRITTDGDFAIFRKDGSVVGSIGTNGTRFYLAGSGRGLAVDESAFSVLPVTTTGTNNDGGVGLGSGSARFSNLYLSGGVYLGGTGSANLLDDYEEGTWTPSMGGTTTYYYQTGEYTKVGNTVFVRGQVSINAIGTGSVSEIGGLPFTSKTTVNGNPAGVLGISYYSGLAIAINYISGYVGSGDTNIQISANAGNNTTVQYNTGNFFGNGARLDFTMAYQVA